MLHKLVYHANRWCYLGLLSVLLILTACGHQGESIEQATPPVITPSSGHGVNKSEQVKGDDQVLRIVITVNHQEFSAVIEHPQLIPYFQTQLPMAMMMTELNGNEKYVQLEHPFTLASERFAEIQPGDLMIYNNTYFVVFYEPVRNHYTYTKIGSLENPAGLKQALGNGDVQFHLQIK